MSTRKASKKPQNLVQRENKIWYCVYRGDDGKRQQKSMETTDLLTAVREQKKFLEERERRAGIRESNNGCATLKDMIDAWVAYSEAYYRRPDGKVTSSHNTVLIVQQALKRYGHLPPQEFDTLMLLEVQRDWVAAGYFRKTVNSYQQYLVRAFKWGVARKFCPVETWQALTAVETIHKCRGIKMPNGKVIVAPERKDIQPVSQELLEATKKYMPRTIANMVELQLLIGARSGEFLDLTPNDLDRTPKTFKGKNGEPITVNVWTVDISRKHKGAWRGKPRILYFGPKAQAILRPYLVNRPGDAYIFNPREVMAERKANCKMHRRPDQLPSPRKSDRVVRDHYDNNSFRHAIVHACNAAKLPLWNPHRLRHSAATYLREEFGLEVASLILGHSDVEVTKIYAERNQAKALEVMSQWG
jgi:integrase